MLLEAVSTVDWSARRRHKRHFRFCTAVGAFDFRHLPRGTRASILVTHLAFHRPYSLVIRKIILAAIIGTGLAAFPLSTQVRSPAYCPRKRQDYYKKCTNTCGCAQTEERFTLKEPFGFYAHSTRVSPLERLASKTVTVFSGEKQEHVYRESSVHVTSCL